MTRTDEPSNEGTVATTTTTEIETVDGKWIIEHYTYKEEYEGNEDLEEKLWKKQEEKYVQNCFRNNLHNLGVVKKYNRRQKRFKQKIR